MNGVGALEHALTRVIEEGFCGYSRGLFYKANLVQNSPLASEFAPDLDYYPNTMHNLCTRRYVPGHHILEIGVGAGHTHTSLHRAASMIEAAHHQKCRVFGIDNQTDKFPIGDTVKMVREIGRQPEIYLMDSYSAATLWKEPLFFLFIDGGHSYEMASFDMDAFIPHVASGSVVAIHDLIIPEVCRAVIERLDWFSDFYIDCIEHHLIYYGLKSQTHNQ